MEKESEKWRKLSGEVVNRPIEEELNAILSREVADGMELKVCIGTDSQVKGNRTDFATVIVFIRKGKGGFMYIQEGSIIRKMSVMQRMLWEVARSIDVAYPLVKLFAKYGIEMEVHADINTDPAFKSNEALGAAIGYITGMGLGVKVKPDAFASSSCANKMVQ